MSHQESLEAHWTDAACHSASVTVTTTNNNLNNGNTALLLQNAANACPFRQSTACKRAASTELPPPCYPNRPSTGVQVCKYARHMAPSHASKPSSLHQWQQPRYVSTNMKGSICKENASCPLYSMEHRDSGYATATSPEDLVNDSDSKDGAALTRDRASESFPSEPGSPSESQSFSQTGLVRCLNNPKHPGIALQLESPYLSSRSLVDEVKAIYIDLTKAEAKCISADNAKMLADASDVGEGQWQALANLHTALLYEHHDFLMATHHPSAPPALRRLAAKYAMPARMWTHGIATFLEVCRSKYPASHECMSAFIYAAYHALTLIYETVPAFTPIWIECLGDLARYRMAIEEDRLEHATWALTAQRWYTLASDKQPSVGRLYHHLSILGRPGLTKFSLYAKSLTCVEAFDSARDSLQALCEPVANGEEDELCGSDAVVAPVVKLHALVFLQSTGSQNAKNVSDDAVSKAAKQATSALEGINAAQLWKIGVPLIVLCVSALLGFGAAHNNLWQQFSRGVGSSSVSQPTDSGMASRRDSSADDASLAFAASRTAVNVTLPPAISFMSACFDAILKFRSTRHELLATLPAVHALLAWLHSLQRLNDKRVFDAYAGRDRMDWSMLASYLNSLAKLDEHDVVDGHLTSCARRNCFDYMPADRGSEEQLSGSAPPILSEDFHLRGLMWTRSYYPPGYFDEPASMISTAPQPSKDSKQASEDSQSSIRDRVRRVMWLALSLALSPKQGNEKTDEKDKHDAEVVSGLRWDESNGCGRFVSDNAAA